MPVDEGRQREKLYKPPIAYMPNAIWVIVFVFYVLIMLVNQSRVETDPWFAWGGWMWFAAVVFFKIAPMKISIDSRKCVGNRIGSTVYQGKPVGRIPAEDGYPDLVVFPAGSVGAWNFYDTALTTRSLVILPKWLAHDYNGQPAFNTWLETYLDHDELPPHVVRWLREDMTRPKYDPNMPIEFGKWPYLVRKPTEEDVKKFAEQMDAKGVPKKMLDNIMDDIEAYACLTTVFKVPERVDEDEDLRIRALNRKYHNLQQDYNALLTRHGNLMRLVRFQDETPEKKEPLIPLIPPRNQPEPQRDYSQYRDQR